jgi:hypothetical protein
MRCLGGKQPPQPLQGKGLALHKADLFEEVERVVKSLINDML